MTVRRVALGEVLDPQPSERVHPDETYPIAGVYGFARGVLIRDSLKGYETKYKSLTRLKPGFVVYSKLKAFEGAVAVATAAADDHFVSQEFPVFAPHSEVDTGYLRHALATPMFLRRLATKSTGLGARRERVHPDKFLALTIPLPPIHEQERIAEYLDGVESASVTTTQDSHIDGILDAAMQRGTHSAPRIRFGDALSLQRRSVQLDPTTEYREIGVRSFGRGIFIKEPRPGSDIGAKRVFTIRDGDVVISNVFAWEGAVARATKDHDGLIGSHRFMTWTSNRTTVSTAFIDAYLRSKEGVALLATASPGSAGRNRTLSVSALSRLEVPRPSRHTQARIAAIAQQLQRIRHKRAEATVIAAALLPAARNEVFTELG